MMLHAGAPPPQESVAPVGKTTPPLRRLPLIVGSQLRLAPGIVALPSTMEPPNVWPPTPEQVCPTGTSILQAPVGMTWRPPPPPKVCCPDCLNCAVLTIEERTLAPPRSTVVPLPLT